MLHVPTLDELHARHRTARQNAWKRRADQFRDHVSHRLEGDMMRAAERLQTSVTYSINAIWPHETVSLFCFEDDPMVEMRRAFDSIFPAHVVYVDDMDDSSQVSWRLIHDAKIVTGIKIEWSKPTPDSYKRSNLDDATTPVKRVKKEC